jgi:glycosyltransferase involved in cell wall biosynthesis/capsular polysaccharide biosynthesis protein
MIASQREGPCVSVIMIFLNAARFLDAAVQSVRNQTYDDWELLLVDDGSTDGCTGLAKKVAAADPRRIRYLEHPGHVNLGQAAARNLGIRHARGKYLAFLDADDVYLPQKLEKQVEILDAHPDVAMVYGPLLFWYGWTGEPADVARDFTCLMDDGNRQGVVAPPDMVIAQVRARNGLPGTCSVLLRRNVVDAVGGFDESFPRMYEDELFFAKIAIRHSVYVMDRYRQHSDSFCAKAIESGEYAMTQGPANKARLKWLTWLAHHVKTLDIADPLLSQLLQREIAVYNEVPATPPVLTAPTHLSKSPARKVAFLIPGSPVRPFFAQIAAFRLALSKLRWTHWQPHVFVCMGGEVDGEALAQWRPYLHDVPIVLVPPAVTEANPHYYGQIDELYRSAPTDADVYVRMDADTLPVGDLEDLLDFVVDRNSIAGVMAHFHFPLHAGTTARASWMQIAEGLIDRPFDFRLAYSLAAPDAPEDNRISPFYLNDGAVFFPRSLFAEYSKHYLRLRPMLMDRLAAPYFAGQIALTLAVTQIGARTCALPMRYNFPNDELATARVPEELEKVCIFHYLRTDEFDRALIFDGEANYQKFLSARFQRASNQVFQRHVRRLFGSSYPFPKVVAWAARRLPFVLPRSKEAYDLACAEHLRAIGPRIAQIAAELQDATLDPFQRRVREVEKQILSSGLFDEQFYLERNPDVRAAKVDALWHYVVAGEQERRAPNPFFDAAYYRDRWMKNAPIESNALAHYAAEGEAKRHRPSVDFDPAGYLAANPELQAFVDRPLFHFLMVGHAAGLTAKAPRARALEFIEQFEKSGKVALERLMKAKQSLVADLGVERGFEVLRDAAVLPDCDQLRVETLQGQQAYAQQRAEVYLETSAGGKPFAVNPPKLVGEGKLRAIEHVSRTLYVACLGEARVRGRSALVEVEGAGLLDYEDWEFELFDCELDIDPAIFHVEGKKIWVTERDDRRAAMEVAEAFMLLGPQTGAFGDWMYQVLPRYVAADMTGALPIMPVLIDEGLHPSIRESLQLMLRPGVEVIAVPAYSTVGVKRLWCASNLHYAPAREKMDARYKFDYNSYNPATFAPMLREMSRRAALAIPETPGPEKVFLARKPQLWRKLVNHTEIEAVARDHGLQIVYPEDLSFAEQVAIVRGARYLAGPEGSAFALTYFCKPGAKICVLCHPIIESAACMTDVIDGVDITVFTGPVIRSDPNFPHRADYEIDAARFSKFLDQWLVG